MDEERLKRAKRKDKSKAVAPIVIRGRVKDSSKTNNLLLNELVGLEGELVRVHILTDKKFAATITIKGGEFEQSFKSNIKKGFNTINIGQHVNRDQVLTVSTTATLTNVYVAAIIKPVMSSDIILKVSTDDERD